MTKNSGGTPHVLGIRADDRIQFIGPPSAIKALGALPEGVVLSPLHAPAPRVGVIAVEDRNDLRERLITELDGLKGADRVWVLSRIAAASPDEDAIGEEARSLSWTAGQAVTLADSWLAVNLIFGA